jgi:hypothetical protein
MCFYVFHHVAAEYVYVYRRCQLVRMVYHLLDGVFKYWHNVRKVRAGGIIPEVK